MMTLGGILSLTYNRFSHQQPLAATRAGNEIRRPERMIADLLLCVRGECLGRGAIGGSIRGSRQSDEIWMSRFSHFPPPGLTVLNDIARRA